MRQRSSDKSVKSSNNSLPSVSPSGNVSITRDQSSHQSTVGYTGYGGITNVRSPQPNLQSPYDSGYGTTNNYSPYGAANSYVKSTAAPPEKKQKKKKEKRFSPMGFRPPKHKPESRD